MEGEHQEIELDFGENGLNPAIAQDAETNEIYCRP